MSWLGDLPEGRDERLKNMEQVVLKPQNLPAQLCSSADSLPAEGCQSISNLMTEAYVTDLMSGKLFEAIWKHEPLSGKSLVQP